MAFTWKFDRSNENSKKKDAVCDKTRARICKVFKLVSFTFCSIGFLLTSLAVFYNFANGTTVISTIVAPSPNNLLEFPPILICNSSAYKEQILNTSLDVFKSNTMSLKDALIDAYLVRRNPGEGALTDVMLPSIKENAKEILTLTHGTCMLIDLKIKVHCQVFERLKHKG